MSIRRVFLAAVSDGDTDIELSPEESHHIGRVLRLSLGDTVAVFNGRGQEWAATITFLDRSIARLRVGKEITTPVEPSMPVFLYQGLCRSDRMEWVIQKGAEIGLSGLFPLRTQRTETSFVSDSRLSRWRRIALEACKQSGRRCLPYIGDLTDLPGPVPKGELGLVLDPGPDSEPIRAILEQPAPSRVMLAVGPEGGFADQEVRELRSRGWAGAHLGPRILRTETAGVVAASLVLCAWGDLGSQPIAAPG
jgi:16S rRNA (uracil1498-N3)-methyltransferase